MEKEDKVSSYEDIIRDFRQNHQLIQGTLMEHVVGMKPVDTHWLMVRFKTTLGGCCLNRARTVRPFAYSVSTRSTMPESELPWLAAGLPVYYHGSNGDRVSATVVGPSPRGGRRVSIRYELGGEEVLYEHAPAQATR